MISNLIFNQIRNRKLGIEAIQYNYSISKLATETKKYVKAISPGGDYEPSDVLESEEEVDAVCEAISILKAYEVIVKAWKETHELSKTS